ncbi:hypothetical protein AcV5_002973 [Taiwanofungus camphoratus]|nr:hypothetical protein AcV5_002973 [Antrodia cinnamomea]
MSKQLESPASLPVAPPPDLAPPKKKQPYPFWLGGVAATIAASITHPLDLTKVRMQAVGDKRMIASIRKTVHTAGVRGLFDGITGTWLRQMSYSLCRFWAYDESKKLLGAGPQSPAWQLALAGSMAGGIAGLVGNPGEIIMVRLQGDLAKPPEQRLNYKHALDGLVRMVREEGWSSLGRGVGPNVFRAVLMNASQLASCVPSSPSPSPSPLRAADGRGAGTTSSRRSCSRRRTLRTTSACTSPRASLRARWRRRCARPRT